MAAAALRQPFSLKGSEGCAARGGARRVVLAPSRRLVGRGAESSRGV